MKRNNTAENPVPNRKPVPRRPQIRNLTVTPFLRINHYSETWVSEIRLRGLWLANLGFLPEQKVTVITMEKELIIKLAE